MTAQSPTPDAVYAHGETVALPAVEPGVQVGCLRVLNVHDAGAAPPGPYLVKNLFYANQLCVVFGEPGCGKSFLMSHIAYAVAQGRAVFDRKVKQAGVLYLSLEGGSGFGRRIKALKNAFSDCDAFRFVAHPVTFFDQDDAADSVIEAALKWSITLIFIDTLARAMGAADENASQDMGRLIRIVDRVREKTGACVVLIHHGPKNGASFPRGHSSLMGAADLILQVERDDHSDVRRAIVTKAKDGEEGASIGFRLHQVEVGIDTDGDPITTCIVEPCDAPARTREDKLNVDDQANLAVIHDRFADPEATQMVCPRPDMPLVPVVTRDQLRDAYRRAGRFDAAPGKALTEADRKKLQRMLERLANRGAICMSDRHVWLPYDA
jgi:hypothetical protein